MGGEGVRWDPISGRIQPHSGGMEGERARGREGRKEAGGGEHNSSHGREMSNTKPFMPMRSTFLKGSCL